MGLYGGGGTTVNYQAPVIPKDDTFANLLKYQQEKEDRAQRRADEEKAEQKAAADARKASAAASYSGMKRGVEEQLRQGLISYGDATSQLRDYSAKYDLTPFSTPDLSSYVSQNKDIQDFITAGRQAGITDNATWGNETNWLEAANKQYGTSAKDLGEFSEQQLGNLHYNLFGKNENRQGVTFNGPNVEQDVSNLTNIYTKELLPGRRATGISAAYEEMLGRQATEEEKTKATERFNQGYYSTFQDLRDSIAKSTEYQDKFNQSYLDNYFDTMFGKQATDAAGKKTGQRTFKFDKTLLPSYTEATKNRAGVATPNFADAFTGTPAEIEEQQQNIRDTRKYLYSAGLTNLQGEIDKETQKLKNEGSREVARISKEGDIYQSLVGAFNFS